MNNMDELDRLLERLEKEEQQKRMAAEEARIKAEREAKEAEETLKRAKVAAEKVKEAKRIEEEAKRLSDEAMAACNNITGNNNDYSSSYSDEKIVEKETRKKKSGNGFVKGLVIGAGAVAILVGACKLCKDAKGGKIVISIEKEAVDTIKGQDDGKYIYDSKGNLIGIDESKYEYEEITKEKFYELVNKKITECREKNIAFDEEDVELFVFNANINKILVDIPEFYSEKMKEWSQKIGGSDLDAIVTNKMLDGESLQDAMNDYNCELFRANHSTDGFIWVSDIIFDQAEREKVEFVEGKIKEIGKYARTDVDKMNELITPFLTDFYDCSLDIYNMESGTSYGLRYLLRPIRQVFGVEDCDERISTLNEANTHLIKYFVSNVGDENEYYISGWGTRAYQNVYGILRDGKCNTLTR